MSRTLIVLLGLLGVLLLTLMCSCRVQDDIQTRAQAALDDSEAWASVQGDGRNVLVSGVAPSQSSIDDALANAAVWGTRRVTTDATLHFVSPSDIAPVRGRLAGAGLSWVDAEAEDRTLALKGLAAAAEERDQAGEIVEPLWPFGPIDNRIRVASNDFQRAAVACRTAIRSLQEEQAVQFESGSAALLPESLALLDQVVDVLTTCPESSLRIEAHSDNTGERQMNLDLSKSRAASVLQYLTAQGVSSTRLSSEGYGESRPIASNDTPEGRAENRRVEFNVDA